MKNNRKRRNERAARELKPYSYLIVCEGTKTEPNYFEGLRKKIIEKYGNRIDVVCPLKIKIDGIGCNTESLVEYTAKKVNYSSNQYGQVWVIFDKDDFTSEQFNNAIISNKYNSGWSNPSFELWLLLHFGKIENSLTKETVIKKLQEQFKKNNLGLYIKNDITIFDKVSKKGDISVAIKAASELAIEYKNKTPSSSNPCTTVYKLLEELKDYLN